MTPDNGFFAIEHVAYIVSDVLFMYPMRLGTYYGSYSERLNADKRQNVFRTVPVIHQLNPRSGTDETIYNSLKAGELATTYASSRDLILMIPTLYKMANAMLPHVLHVACLRITSDAPSEDHSDIMALRETGLAIVASKSSDECRDMALIVHVASVKSRVPMLHFFDGLLDSKDFASSSDLIPHVELAQLIHSHPGYDDTVEEFRKRVAVEDEEENDLYIDVSRTAQEKFQASINILEDTMQHFNTVLGKGYQLYEYYGDDTAEFVLVISGTGGERAIRATETMMKNWNARIGIVYVRVYRPWSSEKFLRVLPRTAKAIAVLDRCEDSATAGEPLYMDVISAFYCELWNEKRPKIVGGTYGVGKSTFDEVSVRTIFEDLASDDLKNGFQAVTIENLSQISTPKISSISSLSIEKPYLRIFELLFGSRALVANLIGADSLQIQSSGDIVESLRLSNAKVAAINGSSEFGFGVHVALAQLRRSLVKLVEEYVASAPVTRLSHCLSKWLDGSEDHVDLVEEIMVLLDSSEIDQDMILSKICAQKHLLPVFSHWIIGNDEWCDDLGLSGLHQAISSGENINILILDTEPYSKVKSEIESLERKRRKKDLGLYAMTYGGIYVASVALHDSYSHVLRAITEADAYPGPSVVLAYAPNAADVQTLEEETRAAVNSGYWPLYRWNPTLEKQGLKPFALDSPALKTQLRHFLERENQLTIMGKDLPKFDDVLNESMESRLDSFLMSSFAKLRGNLQSSEDGKSVSLLILFGSDNGNAESIAATFQEEAEAHGVKVTITDMNDFSVEDLEAVSQPVLFVCSTAGQGEFPNNAKEFWVSLNENTNLNFGNLQYAVFGLGDSHYWPREEEKHYFCKAPKDLDDRLNELGAKSLLEIGIGDDQDDDGPETGLEKWKPRFFDIIGANGLKKVHEKSKKKITNEDIKAGSNFLRGTLEEGLQDRSTAALCESDTQLTKFHGIYQQDNRDLRAKLRAEKKEKAYSFMIRVRVPGGISTPAQYLMIDQLSDEYANGNIKITTRQAYQLQGILKWDLKNTVKGINRCLMDSLAACGDVNRNVMANPNPDQSEFHTQVWEVAKEISEHLTPQTSAYHEIWLDKKCVQGGDGEKRDFEPLYGEAYLPRKFKIAIAVPPSNDVDVFAHCLGFIAIIQDNQLVGFNVTVGGGMGMTHNNEATFPRLADVMGFCLPHQAKEVAEKVLIVQRDHGDRNNRKHARFKYTVEDHGVNWIRDQVEKHLGYALQPALPFEFKYNGDRFGWTSGLNGRSHYTLFVEGGRVKGVIQTALREIAHTLNTSGGPEDGDFRLTANQNVIIGNVTPSQRVVVTQIMEKYGINNEGLSALRLNSIACAALPFCGLALAESERYLPGLISKIDEILDECGLQQDAIVIRMTGCPNGCGRPYLGEIGFVGRAPGLYNLYLGAGFAGERLNKLYKEALDEEGILCHLSPILYRYAKERHVEEKFGDFVIRAGYVSACEAAPLVPVRAAGSSFHA